MWEDLVLVKEQRCIVIHLRLGPEAEAADLAESYGADEEILLTEEISPVELGPPDAFAKFRH